MSQGCGVQKKHDVMRFGSKVRDFSHKKAGMIHPFGIHRIIDVLFEQFGPRVLPLDDIEQELYRAFRRVVVQDRRGPVVYANTWLYNGRDSKRHRRFYLRGRTGKVQLSRTYYNDSVRSMFRPEWDLKTWWVLEGTEKMSDAQKRQMVTKLRLKLRMVGYTVHDVKFRRVERGLAFRWTITEKPA